MICFNLSQPTKRPRDKNATSALNIEIDSNARLGKHLTNPDNSHVTSRSPS